MGARGQLSTGGRRGGKGAARAEVDAVGFKEHNAEGVGRGFAEDVAKPSELRAKN